MTKRIYWNSGWEFTSRADDAFLRGEGTAEQMVRLPHTCAETPYDYFDESIYQMVCAYRRRVTVPQEWADKRLLLTVGAAGHRAQVYADGVLCAEHACGYTAFTAELSLAPGEHVVSIQVDSRETLDQPPFGFVIDYMTYGGLYREVWLDVKERSYIEDVFAMPQLTALQPTAGRVLSQVRCVEGEGLTLRQTLRREGEELTAAAHCGGAMTELTLPVPSPVLWDTERPALYELTTELLRGEEVLDRRTDRIGFRDIRFAADGFYLNGVKTKLRGLNRHQSYPYVGYAMPASMQRLDADILKNELGLNAVRTSHYPQSHDFIDRCDELGLLVFTEIPGWQHIGGEGWKEQAVENTREMVCQYRNHPSVILWGVRINESVDDDALYARTNEVSHTLDPTRPTGGVRCYKKGSLLEDVYTYNDFVHAGNNRGCERKKDVTSDMSKAYLVSEYNGHMFPTKAYDSEEHHLSHILRHAAVLDAVAGEEDVAGSFGWCMADYNTHRQFGSGDRICYHGVLDMFRNPKPAAAVYAAERDGEPVLEVSSTMDIGEHPASNRGKIFLLTNADSVRMYRDGELLHEYTHADSPYGHLRRGPILVTDFIGRRLEREEKMPHRQAELVKEILNYSAVYGFDTLPLSIKLKAAKAMLLYRMTFQDAYRLYGKYIGNWGGMAPSFRFEAVKDGKVVKTVEKAPVSCVSLRVQADHTELRDGRTYDVASLRLTACDGGGERLPFFNEAVALETEGPIELIGPATAQLRGGIGGTYVKTTGESGPAALTLRCGHAPPVRIEFTVTKTEEEKG
ncbi:MAG: glycoside hydrolase family 2 protein [Oscillospiraceae bacterium]|nr:glycoside hydrolase family 2 protein [Oscillospiraceae bacterium]